MTVFSCPSKLRNSKISARSVIQGAELKLVFDGASGVRKQSNVGGYFQIVGRESKPQGRADRGSGRCTLNGFNTTKNE